MRKSTFIALSLYIICTCSLLHAQNTEPVIQPDTSHKNYATSYCEISFGAAIPLGGFAKESGAGYGEYASLGNNFNISFGIHFTHSNFGVAFMYGSFTNFFDIATYVNNIQTSDPNKTYSAIRGDEYDESFFMTGFFGSYPLHNFSFDFRLMGGVALCYLPEVNYGADPTLEGYYNYNWDTYSSRSSALAVDIGGDIRYKIRGMSIILNIDYVSANPMVNTMQQYDHQNLIYSNTHIGGSIPISLLSIDMGVGYRIK